MTGATVNKQAIKRHELVFTVIYSIHLERLTATLMGRMDRVCSFIQILLGVAIATQYVPVVFGYLMVFIAVSQYAGQFGLKSKEAEASCARWTRLKYAMDGLTDHTLNQKVIEATKKDSTVPGSLKPAAYLKTVRQLNLKSDFCPNINFFQSAIVRVAGGIG